MSSQSSKPPKPPEVDVWRDTPLRFAGYANEVGESFRYVLPRLLAPSYGVALLYVVGDTVDKTLRASQLGAETSALAYTAADVALWQLAASVAIPGFAINQVVKLATQAVEFEGVKARVPPRVAAAAPTVAGLACIPLIIHPIDAAVDYAMDSTLRPFAHARGWTESSPPTGSGGNGAPPLATSPALGGSCAFAANWGFSPRPAGALAFGEDRSARADRGGKGEAREAEGAPGEGEKGRAQEASAREGLLRRHGGLSRRGLTDRGAPAEEFSK